MTSQFLIYWTSIVILLLLVAAADSASVSFAYKTHNDCARDESVETTCQMCAKVTKSNIVFPLCCEGKEEAREWCVKYLDFGLRQRDDSR